jgi:hypothetical protein
VASATAGNPHPLPTEHSPMGEDDSVTVDESAPSAARTTQQQALDTYHGRLRRWRVVYTALGTALLVAVGVVVAIAWSHSEVAHTTLHTVRTPPPTVPLQSTSPAPALAWHTGEATAIGTPYFGGTVVTYSAHTVNGRNALTGAVTWSYTRTDRTVCQVIEDQAYTITVFEQKGDCTQVTTLDTQTGQRHWQRTLDEDDTRADGKAVQRIVGKASYAVSLSTVLIYSSSIIYAIDPVGGLDRWLFDHAGCTIHSAILGAQGALISQTCVHQACGQRKFCFDGNQVLLRDGTAARAETDKNPQNYDQVIWNKPEIDAVPASADEVVSVVDPAGTHLTVLDQTKGSTLATLPLRGTSATTGIAQVQTARAELIWIGDITYSIETSGTDFFWVASSLGPPTVTAQPGSLTQPVDLNQAIVLVPNTGGADLLSPANGVAVTHYAIGSVPPFARVYPLGSGLLVTGSATAFYR